MLGPCLQGEGSVWEVAAQKSCGGFFHSQRLQGSFIDVDGIPIRSGMSVGRNRSYEVRKNPFLGSHFQE
jgi:hypothetical protein